MSARARFADGMSVDEFLRWKPYPTRLWQLVDGEPQLMSPPSPTHALVLGEIARVIGNHLRERGGSCRVYVTPGIVPRVRSGHNMRVPDLAVSCVRQEAGRRDLAEPVLVVEVLSPSNEGSTWANVWAYTSIPSVREILVLRTDSAMAEVVRRGADGTWPGEPERVEAGDLVLDGIGLRTELMELYRGTVLNPDGE